MWEKLKGLSMGAKAGIASGVALLAAAGIGLGVWQPWNQPDSEPDEPDIQQQEPAEPQKQPEKGLSLRVDGEEVPCVLYEGNGWSIYVPEDWSTEKLGTNGGLFSSNDGAQLSVRLEPDRTYTGRFVNLSDNGSHRVLQFYQGTGTESMVVEGNAPTTKWDQYHKLFVAMARTLTVGEEKPFEESYIIPQEPDWQTAEGMTILFLDKDGYVVDDKAQEAIEAYMQSWPVEARAIYTGQYRINRLVWAGSYTGVMKDGYVDVFRADTQYRVREGAAPEGVTVVDSWASDGDSVYLAIFHDGGTVSKTQWTASQLEDGWAGLLRDIS